MACKSTNTSNIIIFQEEPVYSRNSFPYASHSHNLSSSNHNPSHKVHQSRFQVQYRYKKIRHLHSWLKLRQEARCQYESICMSFLYDNQGDSIGEGAEYFEFIQKGTPPKKLRVSSSDESQSVLSMSNKSNNDSCNVKAIIYCVMLERKPYFTWTIGYFNLLVLSKIAQSAKLEYLKAVNSTLGGAYSTLQRAGWARLYAKKQLNLALASGDQTLALRAKVYLKICEITATLHPSYAHRKIYEDDVNGVTTKTNRNVHHSEALRIPDHLRTKLKADLKALLEQAMLIGDESILGLISFANFRIDTH